VIQRIRQLVTKSDPQRARVDVNDVIRDVLPLVRSEVRSHDVSFRLDLAPALQPVLSDRVQLQQVLINLVMNGIEAMASVDDRPRKLVIRSQPHEGDQVLVAVERRRRRDRPGEGRPAVQRILHQQARRHGDGIVDQPLDHRGARRTAVGDTERDARRHLSLHPAGHAMTSGSPVVLVVDDDASVRDGLRRLITSVGFMAEVFLLPLLSRATWRRATRGAMGRTR
jgi:signal transduction histidine kinase